LKHASLCTDIAALCSVFTSSFRVTKRFHIKLPPGLKDNSCLTVQSYEVFQVLKKIFQAVRHLFRCKAFVIAVLHAISLPSDFYRNVAEGVKRTGGWCGWSNFSPRGYKYQLTRRKVWASHKWLRVCATALLFVVCVCHSN
jgi:hypothetical protein